MTIRLLKQALAEHIVRQVGALTLEAPNDNEALEIRKRNHVDMMILDVEMPYIEILSVITELLRLISVTT